MARCILRCFFYDEKNSSLIKSLQLNKGTENLRHYKLEPYKGSYSFMIFVLCYNYLPLPFPNA